MSGGLNLYGPDTQYPVLRSNILTFLENNPSEPFNEFLYYTIGELDKALQRNPNSPIIDVINYARGHQLLQLLLQDVPAAIKEKVLSLGYSSNVDLGPVNSTPELVSRAL